MTDIATAKPIRTVKKRNPKLAVEPVTGWKIAEISSDGTIRIRALRFNSIGAAAKEIFLLRAKFAKANNEYVVLPYADHTLEYNKNLWMLTERNRVRAAYYSKYFQQKGGKFIIEKHARPLYVQAGDVCVFRLNGDGFDSETLEYKTSTRRVIRVRDRREWEEHGSRYYQMVEYETLPTDDKYRLASPSGQCDSSLVKSIVSRERCSLKPHVNVYATGRRAEYYPEPDTMDLLGMVQYVLHNNWHREVPRSISRRKLFMQWERDGFPGTSGASSNDERIFERFRIVRMKRFRKWVLMNYHNWFDNLAVDRTRCMQRAAAESRELEDY